MKKQTLIFIMVLLIFGGCKKFMAVPDDCSAYDYYDCNTIEPDLTDATFKFTLNNQIQSVPFIIYQGDIEDNKPLFYDTAYNSEVYYYLEFGKYSIKATYNIQGKTIYVIDGALAEKWSNQICDSVCWGWDSLNLDLQIH